MHDESSSISEFINGKSNYLQKLLTYLSGIVTYTFKAGTVGCGDHFVFPSFPCCAGLFRVFPTFVL